ncbi:hypothetical protein MKEN_00433700 [Mycena kentingensis (nom. inval.)]|nr:hypothetical protein MKEN_00433700 [Mycena kentingensis (nom. inval.)]
MSYSFPGEEDLIAMDDEVEPEASSSSDSSDDSSDEASEYELPNAYDPTTAIEGDFDRLVDTIKLHQGPSSGLLAKDWDFNIQDQDAQFRDDLRAASGIGKRRNKQRGRAHGPALSYEVKSLLGDGNVAYVDGNLPEAIRIMLEVIRIEPRAANPWVVLAQCHQDLGQHQQALQLRIMAAHLMHDAEEWDRLAQQSKDLGYSRQALYCLGKLTSLDPANVDAQWDRALLARELGELKTTRHAFLNILKRFPHDLPVLTELRTILIELSDLENCTTLFQAAFEHYQAKYPTGLGPHPTTGEEVPGGGFGYLELLVLADLYNTTGAYGHAVDVIRQGTRWLQGRSEQRYWEMCDDDREYDASGTQRVIQGDPQPGMFPLDINARHRLAIARIKMGELEEAKFHVNCVLAEDVLDYTPLFVEIADAYFDRQLYAEARPIYEILGSDTTTSSLDILLQTAACLRMLNELRESAEVYEYSKSPEIAKSPLLTLKVRLADPTHNDAKLKLAEIYEILNEPRKALELVYEVIDSRRKNNRITEPSAGPGQAPVHSSSLFSEGHSVEKTGKSKSTHARMSLEALKQFEAEMQSETLRGHQRLAELYPKIDLEEQNEYERDWLVQAEKLIEAFRETRKLFSTTRDGFRGMFPSRRVGRGKDKTSEDDELRLASRLQLELENAKSVVTGSDIFRGLNFQDWLRLFFQYAFLLSQRGQYDLAEEVLKHILLSTAFKSTEFQTRIRLALLTCAISVNDAATIVEHSRWLIMTHQFNNEAIRIYLASLVGGPRSTDAFILTALQKAIYREMKLVHLCTTNPEQVKWLPPRRRFGVSKAAADADDDDNPEEDEGTGAGAGSAVAKTLPEESKTMSPVIMVLYGQMCVAAKSYQSAIFYLLQAYDLCPTDPVICISLAIASMGRAMQRQSDNRHHLITQAMALLSQYRQLRKEEVCGVGEIDYNFARAFHQLGLYSHAVTHYERVLEQAERLESRYDSLAQEAAFNLSTIYLTTGATTLAKGLFRRWLSI